MLHYQVVFISWTTNMPEQCLNAPSFEYTITLMTPWARACSGVACSTEMSNEYDQHPSPLPLFTGAVKAKKIHVVFSHNSISTAPGCGGRSERRRIEEGCFRFEAYFCSPLTSLQWSIARKNKLQNTRIPITKHFFDRLCRKT